MTHYRLCHASRPEFRWACGPPKKMKMARTNIEWVSRWDRFLRRNPGLKSETWATHSKSGGCSLIFDRLPFINQALRVILLNGRVIPCAPNVTCIVCWAGLACKVCQFKKNAVDSVPLKRFVIPTGAQRSGGKGLLVGLCTVYPQHVGVPMLLRGMSTARVFLRPKGTRPC